MPCLFCCPFLAVPDAPATQAICGICGVAHGAPTVVQPKASPDASWNMNPCASSSEGETMITGQIAGSGATAERYALVQKTPSHFPSGPRQRRARRRGSVEDWTVTPVDALASFGYSLSGSSCPVVPEPPIT